MTKLGIFNDGDKIRIYTPYNPDYVTDLKNAIHWQSRRFDRPEQCWEIDLCQADTAIEICKAYYPRIHDGTTDTGEHHEANVNDAETAYIRVLQDTIMEHHDLLEDRIMSLEYDLSDYSWGEYDGKKRALLTERRRIEYAIEYAEDDPYELEDIAIATMKKVINIYQLSMII